MLVVLRSKLHGPLTPAFALLYRTVVLSEEFILFCVFVRTALCLCYQLLEQALVIEEQLRKASVENTSNVEPAQENSDSAYAAEDKSSKPDQLDDYLVF